MAQVAGAWKLNESGGGVGMLEIHLADAPWRNKRLRQALVDINQGKITDHQSLLADLVPEMKPIAPTPGSIDRSNLANIPAAIQAAIDARSVDAYEDCYIQVDGNKASAMRVEAEIDIDSNKLDIALHTRFSKAAADQLSKAGNLVHDPLISKPKVEMFKDYVWNIDGNIARGIPLHWTRYGNFTRLRRDNGIWRIETLSGRLDDRERKSDAENYNEIHQRLAGILAHLNEYPDPGSVLEVLDPIRAESHADEKKNEQLAEARRMETAEALKRHEKEATTQRALMSAQDRSTDELQTSFLKQIYADPKSTTRPVILFAAENDPLQSYVRAREHRAEAAQGLRDAAQHQLYGGASGLAYPLSLGPWQNMETFQSLKWTFNGNHAVGTPPEGLDQNYHWKMLKIGNDWKTDVTDETLGDPAKAAAVAEKEAEAMEQIAKDINSGKLRSDEDAQAAIRAAITRATQ
jgi:hypothetical protein